MSLLTLLDSSDAAVKAWKTFCRARLTALGKDPYYFYLTAPADAQGEDYIVGALPAESTAPSTAGGGASSRTKLAQDLVCVAACWSADPEASRAMAAEVKENAHTFSVTGFTTIKADLSGHSETLDEEPGLTPYVVNTVTFAFQLRKN